MERMVKNNMIGARKLALDTMSQTESYILELLPLMNENELKAIQKMVFNLTWQIRKELIKRR